MSSSAFNNDIVLVFLLLLLVMLIYYYPFYSRIEFEKFMYKITFESLARKRVRESYKHGQVSDKSSQTDVVTMDSVVILAQ
jgi:hypothetical protein